MAVGELYGGAALEGAQDYKEPVIVPVTREPSASVATESDELATDQGEYKPTPDFYDGLNALSQKVYELAPKALAHLNGLMGREQDHRLKLIDQRLSGQQLKLEDETIWLQTMEEEIERGLAAPETFRGDITTYSARIERRQGIIDQLYERRLDHLMAKSDGSNS
ncbi:MAG: hypothetical protein HZB70_03335 [Candidatus Berkelbacteria bacterium]|nr:MAG: hypothetical protein HZB70_03335 [Candidatus Berkelbacteria bacterium]QQG51665.1 MAG: hypothetical protein HY845_03855 [Candidatus Berkelbacteria bacterium]